MINNLLEVLLEMGNGQKDHTIIIIMLIVVVEF